MQNFSPLSSFPKLKIFLISLLLLLANAFSPSVFATADLEKVRIGILAKRGKEIGEQRWASTAIYLEKMIAGKSFEIVPLSFEEVDSYVAKRKVEFILVNPAIYVQLEKSYQVSRIATLASNYASTNFSTLGSVILSRADSLVLSTPKDITARSVAAVHPRSLGGWQIAMARIERAGINTQTDLKSLRFLGTHDLVVQAVLKGAAEVGIVRTGTLEAMEKEAKIKIDDFSILSSPDSTLFFPLHTSTQLYPDWAFAKVKHTANDLARQVSAALLLMKPTDKAAFNANISGWTIPENYTPVHHLLEELRLPPYDDVEPTSVKQFVFQHTLISLLIFASFIMLVAMYVRQKLLTKQIKKARNRLKDYSNRLQLAAEAGELGIWEWHVKKNRFYCDDRVTQLFGLDNPANTYTTHQWHSRVHPDDIERVQTAMHLALSGGKKFDVEYRIMTDNAKFCAVRSASIYRYSQSKGGLIVNGVTWDISSHRKLVEENKKLATLDPLTSAKNRRGFYPLARAEFNRCRRYGGKLAILMIDIDNFKTINDTSGHSMGDSTLVTLVDVCHAVLRTSDLFCRLGGEEFIALLHENSIKQAHVVAERLRTEIENVKVKSEESSIKFTISIGISVLIEADQTIEDTISRADNALYKAKSNGKNCVVSDA